MKDFIWRDGTPRSRVLSAATLRAEAGALRDSEATAPDWNTIRGLLQQSYRDLHAALADSE